MAISIQMELNERLYLRNPEETKLGKKIIQVSIQLIDEIGFEKFTFKKLAGQIGSTEASVYRYFENKHKLLVYLVSWYWEWVKFQIDFNTMNLVDPREKLRRVITVLVESSKENPYIEHIDEQILHRIVVAEASKAYHTKGVDEENKEGFFLNYKVLVARIGAILQEINSNFLYPKALASNLIEMANHHIYFAEHLPALTDVTIKESRDLSEIQDLLMFFAFKLIDAQN
jgi:AcrR family transcriptional regulator